MNSPVRAFGAVGGTPRFVERGRGPTSAATAGTMFGLYLLKGDGRVIADYASAKAYADPARYGALCHALPARGVYLAPSQFEAGFLS